MQDPKGKQAPPPAKNAAPAAAAKPAGSQVPATRPQAQVVKREQFLPDKPIDSVELLHRTFDSLRGRANVLMPIVHMDMLPPLTQISLRAVEIDVTLDERTGQGREVYFDPRFCYDPKRGEDPDLREVALGKVGLTKIMRAAGMQKLSSARVDDGSVLFFCSWSILLAVLDFDGTWSQYAISKELDFRDGMPDTLKPEWSDASGKWRKTGRLISLDASAIADKRRHQPALAETKCLERGIREVLMLAQKFKIKDLRLPFVVPKLVPKLDLDDPQQKAIYLERMVWGERALFGPGAQDAGRRTRVLAGLNRSMGLPAPDEPRRRPTPPERETCLVHDGVELEDGVCSMCEDEAQRRLVQAEVVTPAAPASSPPTITEDLFPDIPPTRPATETAKPAEPEVVEERCGCPCTCVATISPGEASTSIAKIGAKRCERCYPGPKFDFERHPDELDLKLPNYPGATAVKVRAWQKARAAQS